MAEQLTLAIDFDGTIVEHQYPKIGKEMPGAFATLKDLQAAGHKLILWTFRAGSYLDDAIHYCEENGISFWCVNQSYPGEEVDDNTSRLIKADYFIDDRNVGGFYGWDNVRKVLLQ